MGVDFSHCNASWSYSGFHNARKRLAKEIGIDLDKMEGFKGDEQLPWDNVTDPIKDLLDHSDCDGELTPDQCTAIAPRLRELVKDWPDDDDKQNFLELANGMDDAAFADEPLRFS